MRTLRASFHDPRTIALTGASLLLIAFKLWLIAGEDIIGSATQYDALWYVRSATHWYWSNPYHWTAFIRPCAYPLWIAVVHLLHVPLRLAIELLQLGGALVLLVAFRALGVNRLVSFLSFAAICLHPAGFQLNDYTMSDTFYAALLWWLLGGMLLTLATRSGWFAFPTGIIFAALWNTREEGLLLVAIAAIWSSLLFAREKIAGRSLRATLATVSKPLIITFALASIVVTSIYAENHMRFGSFARSEMTARRFEALFHSLLRIKPTEPKPYAPITTDTLHRAFGASPTLATLQKDLDGPLGDAWRVETFRRTGVSHEIGAGWIVWAIRMAASQIGVFENPDKAQRFFKKATREISAACGDGRLPTRFVVDGFLDPLAQSGGLARLPYSATRVAARVFAQWPIGVITDDTILTAEEATLYDDMTARRFPGSLQKNARGSAMEDLIGRYHYVFQVALHLLAAIALVLLFVRRRRLAFGGYAITILLLGATIFLRAVLLAWLDATAFDSTQDRFLFPVLPLWSALLFLLIGYNAEIAPKAL